MSAYLVGTLKKYVSKQDSRLNSADSGHGSSKSMHEVTDSGPRADGLCAKPLNWTVVILAWCLCGLAVRSPHLCPAKSAL